MLLLILGLNLNISLIKVKTLHCLFKIEVDRILCFCQDRDRCDEVNKSRWMLGQTCFRWMLSHWRNMFQMYAMLGHSLLKCHAFLPTHTLYKWTNMLSIDVYKFVEDVHSDVND